MTFLPLWKLAATGKMNYRGERGRPWITISKGLNPIFQKLIKKHEKQRKIPIK